jgi:hypothetical protein
MRLPPASFLDDTTDVKLPLTDDRLICCAWRPAVPAIAAASDLALAGRMELESDSAS